MHERIPASEPRTTPMRTRREYYACPMRCSLIAGHSQPVSRASFLRAFVTKAVTAFLACLCGKHAKSVMGKGGSKIGRRPGHTPRNSFSRGAHEAVAWRKAPRSAGRYSIVKLAAAGTGVEKNIIRTYSRHKRVRCDMFGGVLRFKPPGWRKKRRRGESLLIGCSSRERTTCPGVFVAARPQIRSLQASIGELLAQRRHGP